MNFQPLSNRLLVEKVELLTKSQSGLIVMADTEENERRDTVFGKVIAAGPGYKTEHGVIPMDIKVGDFVVYNERTPLKFLHGTYNYDVLRETEVLMVVNGEDIEINTGTSVTKKIGDLLGKHIQQIGS